MRFFNRVSFFYFTCFFTIFFLFVSHQSKAQLNTLGEAQNTLSSAENLVKNASGYVARIQASVKKVKDKQLYKALIDGKEFSFPIGILPASGDQNYALVIDSVYITPEGMFAAIFMQIPIGQDRSLYFLADKVPFSRAGGLAGDLRLYLLRSDSIQVGKGYNIRFDGLEQGGREKSCFVTFNCKGFKDATLAGAVNFNKRSIVKDGKTKEPVSLQYYIQADKLSNFIIQLDDIPSFEFTNLPGFKCSVPSITLDKSEVKNAPGFSLPTWYTDSIKAATGNSELVLNGPDWEGMYIPEIIIEIPKAFKEDKPTEVVTIRSEHLIIDQNGVTGLNSAEEVLNGKIKGWNYSIDSLRINVIASSLSRAAIYGMITLPVASDTSQVAFGLLLTKPIDKDITYSGYIDVAKKNMINAEAFGMAKIKLDRARFEFEYTNDQFYPAAVLTGGINLCPKKNGSSKSFASFGVDFSLLRVSSKAPYLGIDPGGFVQMNGTGSMMSNFPVSIDSVRLVTEAGNQRVGIRMTLRVSLQKSGGDSQGSNGFGGSATFTVWAKRDPVVRKWRYNDFDLNKITVKVDNSSFNLYGELTTFENDPEYGTGFCGYLDMTIVKKINVKVGAIFGRKGQIAVDPEAPLTDSGMADTPSEYRYWFVDAAATFPVITVAPFVGINGFTGGLYHHMKLEKVPSKESTTEVECKSASGMRYVPNDSVYLGLIAGVGLQSVPTSAVFNGNITLGLEFNRSGGLNMVALWGSVTLLTPSFNIPGAAALKDKMDVTVKIDKNGIKEKPPETPANTPKGSLRVKWFTQYDVPNETFIGDFDIFVDMAGIVTGVGPDKNAGHIAVLFSPGAKYVWVGTPLAPIGVDVISLFKCTSYFCAGNTLPDPPMAPLPPEIDKAPIDYNTLETGAGLSFGARVDVGGNFGAEGSLLGCDLWIGAELWVKAGFDVLISKSKQPVYCALKSGMEQRGINNWYATGQAFIAGGMRLGLDYDCGVLGSGTKNLVSASMYAYVFAQLPKPSYIIGKAHAEFKILGIGGNAEIKFKLGEQCENPDQEKDIVFISSILPDSGAVDIKVTEQIVVNFAKPIEKFTFSLPDETSKTGGTLPYRGYVSDSDVLVTVNGTSIPCKYEWNSSKTVLRLSPLSVFPENALIKVDARVVLQYNRGGWTASSKVERKSVTFRTAVEPVRIEEANIAYAYPLPQMKNYYRNESNSGYIKLYSLPRKPMRLAPDYAYHVVFEGGQEKVRVTNVLVNNQAGVEQFTYTIPNDMLVNNATYTLKLVKTPVNAQDKDKHDQTYNLGYVNDSPQDSVILEYTFSTSRFSSFSQKMAYFNQSRVEVSGAAVVHSLLPNSQDVAAGSAEGFGKEETFGFSSGGINSAAPLLRSLGADFSKGFVIAGAQLPDSVAYSFYGGKLVVQYNVFSEMQAANADDKLVDIVCAISAGRADCSRGTGSQDYIFPKAKYYYKLGYFLPGRNQKTSEVTISFDLPEEINISY